MQTHKHSEPLLIGVLPLDICERRHRGNAESIAANLRADKQKGRTAVLSVLISHPATAKEIAAQLGVGINVISGRCSEIKMLGLVRATGVRRSGSMELELVK